MTTPPQDFLADAVVLPAGTTTLQGQSNAGFTRETGEQGGAGSTAWYVWYPRPEQAGETHSFGLGGFDTFLGVYTGPEGATHADLVSVGQNDDANGTIAGVVYNSVVTTVIDATKVYYLQAGGFGPNQGTMSLAFPTAGAKPGTSGSSNVTPRPSDLYRDFVYTRNTVALTATATTITVEDTTLLPASDVLAKTNLFVAFESNFTYPHAFEICRLIAVDAAAKTITLVRGQAGTTAVAHPAATYIKATLTSEMLRRVRTGFTGNTFPNPDADQYLVGDRYYHPTEARFFAFTGRAAYLKDSFGRTSTTTLGSTEVQTVSGTAHDIPAGVTSYNVPYTAPWIVDGGVFGVNASNRAYLVSGSGTPTAYVNVGSTDFEFSLDVQHNSVQTSSGPWYGLWFRGNASRTYGYFLRFRPDGSPSSPQYMELQRIKNGVSTQVFSNGASPFLLGSAYTWTVRCAGTTITILRNGTVVSTFSESDSGMAANIGAHVGYRYGNAQAIADPTLTFDNLVVTHPGNTGLNLPLAQGWAPASPLPSGSAFTTQADLIANHGETLLSVVNQVDDLGAIAAQLESVVNQQSRDTLTLSTNFDELLPFVQSQEVTQRALPQMTAIIDDTIEVVQNLHATGTTRVVTAATTAVRGEVLLASTTTAAFTITLPTPAASLNATVIVKKTDASANVLTISTPAGTIDGTATKTLTTQYATLRLISDGTNWWAI